jgi:EmrB/QacA subfamily drug resistance transporter
MSGDEGRKWWLLVAMGGILGVILLDETVVGVALPTIQVDLGLSEIGSHWVVNVYMLLLAGFAAAAGRIADIVGYRLLMILGLLIFGLASVFCGLAETGVWLILARGVQGVGAAIIFPASLAMVTIAFPPERRGFALGIYGAVGTVFLALGPMVGGLLTDFASWRWIFWINPPIVAAIAAIVFATWTEPARTSPRERLDKPGFGLLAAGLCMVIFATMEGPDWGWDHPTILALMVIGLVMLAAFVAVERRVADPLIDVALFANRTFAACNLVIFLAQYAKMAMFVFGAMYLQDILKMSPLLAGLALLPTVALQVIMAPLAGKAVDAFGARGPILGGLALMTAGFAVTTFGLTQESYFVMFPGLLAWGIAPAFLFVPPQHAVMGAVPPPKRGEAGGIAMASQLVGATVGMAVCSTIFSMTGAYGAVFLASTGITLVVLVIAFIAIEKPRPMPGPAAA